MTRNDEMKLIWRHTGKDFRGIIDGQKTVVYCSNQGSGVCPIDGLPEQIYQEKLSYALRQEAKKKAAI